MDLVPGFSGGFRGARGPWPPKTPEVALWPDELQLQMMQTYIPCLFNMLLIALSIQSNQSIPISSQYTAVSEASQSASL